jgi:hypothetical protein
MSAEFLFLVMIWVKEVIIGSTFFSSYLGQCYIQTEASPQPYEVMVPSDIELAIIACNELSFLQPV